MKRLIETTLYFLKLGFVGLGGPLALIATMQTDWVEKRKWMKAEEFRQALALIKAMPGPVATQVAIYLGRHRSGFLGGLLSGILLILPGFAMMVILAMTYSQFVANAELMPLLSGMQMGALALIFYSIKPLTEIYWLRRRFWLLFFLGYLLTLADIPEAVSIFSLGCLAVVFDGRFRSKVPAIFWATPVEPSVAAAGSSLLSDLFWICFQGGAFLFGTGLAIIPTLQTEFVQHHQWVTAAEFRDALAFGQLTPGPVVLTVSFLGYKMSGMIGAVVATVAVFLPCFFHQLTWFPRAVAYLQKTLWIRAFILGAIAAVAAGIVYVVVEMTKNINAVEGVIFIASLLFLFRFKIPAIVLILSAGCAAYIPQLI